MLTFRHFVTLLETPVAASVGTYSLRQLETTSAEALHAWMELNGIPNPVPIKHLHASVITAKNEMPDYQPDQRPLKVRPASYRIQRLGQGLVMSFKSSEMDRQNSRALSQGARMTWPKFIPHVTLSYSYPGNFDFQSLRTPPFFLEFGPESVKEFDGEVAHSLRESLGRFNNFMFAAAWLGRSK